MEPSGPGPGAPPPADTPAPVRFRWWDTVVVFLAGQILGAGVGFSIGYAFTGDEAGDPKAFTTASGFVGQFAVYWVAVWLFSRRRGTGSLRRDLGFTAHWRDWWALPLGMLLTLVLGALVAPLQRLVDENQAVVDDLKEAGGPELAVFAIAAGLLAPVLEELIFRGLLLRALRWSMSANWAIAVSAVAFGAVHFLGGNVLGTVAVFPALVALGAVSGYLAVRSGDLSQSMLLHIGFNLVAVAGAIVT